MSSSAHRGRILHFLGDPAKLGDKAWEYFEDGLLWIEHGHVRALDHATYLLPQLPADLPLEEHPQRLLLPGFVDCHVHYPQLGVIASYGTQLLDWLETHTFPAEQRFADAGYAAAQAEPVPRRTATPRHHYRAGVRHGPCGIRRGILPGRAEAPPADDRRQGSDGPQRAAGAVRYRGQWLRREPRADRALARQRAPAIRGHPALRADLLTRATGRGGAPAGRVSRRLPAHPSFGEPQGSRLGRRLFPQAQDYLDVYHRAGLVGERSVFAHGIHLSERECRCLAHKNAALAHCPSSNLFIGSGLFDLGRAQQYGIRVGIGSDVGGGTSLSLLANLADAYKIQQLRGTSLDPFQALYLATLGGARALDLDGLVGNFLPGREADFVALDLAATPMIAQRMEHARGLADTLFVLNTLGDDRAVAETWVMGERRHAKE